MIAIELYDYNKREYRVSVVTERETGVEKKNKLKKKNNRTHATIPTHARQTPINCQLLIVDNNSPGLSEDSDRDFHITPGTRDKCY